MINEEGYNVLSDFIKTASRNAIKAYEDLIRLKNGASILDVGCGDGSTTMEILKPLVERHIKGFSITGCDLAIPAVDKAKKIRKEGKISFRQLDIATNDLEKSLLQSFDNIFSFICLHLVPNYRNWTKNVHSMLKPGGQVFLLAVAKNPLCTEIVKQSKEGKWANYMKTAGEIAGTPFTQLPEPKQWIEKLLSQQGFKNVVCKKIEEDFIFKNTEDLKAFIMSFDVIHHDIPKDMLEGFKQEFTELVGNRCKRFPGKPEYHFEYSLLLLVANQ